MAFTTGIDGQFGLAIEGTYGTYAAPTEWHEIVSESLALNITPVESAAVRQGSRFIRSDDWVQGQRSVSGSFDLDLTDENLMNVWKLCWGDVGTPGGAGPYTHALSPATADLPSATIQVGRPERDGTVVPFSYTGCVVPSWTLSASVGGIGALSVNVAGRDEIDSEALGTPSYASGAELLTFVGASVTLAGASFPARDVSLTMDNGLNIDRYFLGAQTMSAPKVAGGSASGTLSAEFFDDTNGTSDTKYAYERFVDGAEAALVLTFGAVTTPAHSVVITANVRTDGTTPNLNGKDITNISVPFTCVATGADSTAISAVVTNNDATDYS